MKRTAFILIAAATWYMAGIYQYTPLMVVFIAELLLAGGMFLLPYQFRRRLTVCFAKSHGTAQRADSFRFAVHIENSGMLPVNHVQIGLKAQYSQFPTSAAQHRLDGGAERRGTTELEFELLAPYCGLLELQIMEMRIYDYLSLFSVKNRAADTMRIAVYPPERILKITVQAGICWDRVDPSSSDTADEVRQIREYQWGDSLRRVHWNQSARTERLWIREYEQMAESVIDLLLDTASERRQSPAEWSAFYEVLSALVLGLLEHGLLLRISWFAGKQGNLQQFEMWQAGQHRELLAQLFQTDFCREKDLFQSQIWYMRLNLDLEWFYGTERTYQFSRTDYETEIMQRHFVL